jgi:hypothetical protein
MEIGLRRKLHDGNIYESIDVAAGARVGDLVEALNLDWVRPFESCPSGDKIFGERLSPDEVLTDGQGYDLFPKNSVETSEMLSNGNKKYVMLDVNATVNRRRLNSVDVGLTRSIDW